MRAISLSSTMGLILILGLPAKAQTDNPVILAVTNGAGMPGEIVEVELLVHRAEEIKGDPTRIAGLDAVLHWDPAIAHLVSVSTTEVTAGWQLAWRIDSGSVDVSAASTDPVAATPVGLRMLAFRFELGSIPGESPLALTGTRIFDLDQVAVEHTVDPGTLSSSVVGVEAVGVGAFKSIF